MLIFWGVTHHGCMGGMVYLLIHDKWMVDCLWQICKIRRDTMHGCMNPKIGILQEFIGQPMTTHGSQVLRSFEVCSPRPESATAVYGFLQEQGAIILVAGFKYLLFSPLLYGNDPIWLKELNPPTSFLPRQTKKNNGHSITHVGGIKQAANVWYFWRISQKMVQKCHKIWANYNDQFMKFGLAYFPILVANQTWCNFCLK